GIDRGVLRRQPTWRELAWRVALFGGAVTATAQILSSAELPLRFRWSAPAAAQIVPAAPANAVPRASLAPRAEREGREAPSIAAASPTPEVEAAPRVRDEPSATHDAFPWAALLLAAWSAGVLLGLGRLARDWASLRRLL